MPLINVKVSHQELRVISEYAAQCGETISDLVRKSIIREATLSDWYGSIDSSYEYSMKMPENVSASVCRTITESNYNKMREMLGMRKIKL